MFAGGVGPSGAVTAAVEIFHPIEAGPIATVGLDQTVTTAATGYATVTLTGTGSSPSGLPLTYDWSQGAVSLGVTPTVTVRLVPGIYTFTFSVTDSNGRSASAVTHVTVRLGMPQVSLSLGGLTFGRQLLATSSSAQSVTLTNTGDNDLIISAISVSGADFQQTHNCPTTLGSRASCTIGVSFKPTAIGARTGTLAVSDNAPASPQTVTLGGTGYGTPSVAFSATSLSFPVQTVGTPATKTIILTNNGTDVLHLVARKLVGDDFTESDSCGNSLSAAATCVVSVTFRPKAGGTRTGDFTLIDDAPGSPHVIHLTGTGGLPNLRFTPTQVGFGAQVIGTAGATLSITLANVGNAAATFTGAFVVSGDFSQTSTCGGTLAACASCTIVLRFSPSDLGPRTGTLTVTSNAPGSPQRVNLSGTGQAGPCGLDVTNRVRGDAPLR